MKNRIFGFWVLAFVSLLPTMDVTAQRVRTTAVFDGDTATRPKAGFYGIGVRSGNVFLVKPTGNTERLANYSLFTGLGTNFLPKWNGSKLVNSQLSESSGFLNSYIPNLIISGTYPTVYLNGTQANGTHIHLRNFVGGVSNSGFEIYDNTNSASRLAISGSGNVGVGTTTPNRRLVVNGDFGFSYSDGNSYAGIRQNLSGGHFGVEFFNVISSSATNRAFSFLDYTLNPIMSLLNGGNVGIGTASPSAKLHVLGDAWIRQADASYLRMTSNTTAANINFNNTTGLSFAYNDGADLMRINSSGNVGIGTTAPAKKLQVSVTDSGDGIGIDGTTNPAFNFRVSGVTKANFGMATASNVWFTGSVANDFAVVASTGNIALVNGSTASLYASSAGNVGIGTTSPTTKLQVVGLPTYADNAAATSGGLTAGAFYRTSTGVLMVVY